MYILCSQCSYPIGVNYIGQTVKCPFCGHREVVTEQEVNMRSENGVAQGEGVVIPSWLFWLSAGLLAGVLFGPTILASSREGALRLARIAEEKLKG